MEDGDLLPVDALLLTSSMFVGDVIAGHGVNPFLECAEAAGCMMASHCSNVDTSSHTAVTLMPRPELLGPL